MYKMRVGSEWERVPQEEVDRIFNDVISDPSVRAYLNQKADLRTFDVSDEEMQKQLSLNLYGNPDDPNDKGLYGVMSDLTSEGKDKEAEAYKNIIEQQESLLHGTGVESPEEMINMRKKAAHQQVIDSEIGRERNAALTKYVRNNVKTKSIQDYDQMWLDDYNRKIDNYIADYKEDGPLVEVAYEGGDTYEKLTSHIDLQKDMQESQVKAFNDHLIGITDDNDKILYQGEPLTQEQILSGDFQNILIEGQPVTDFINIDILKNIQDKIRHHASAENRSQNILTATENKLGIEKEESSEIFRNTKIQIGSGVGNQSTTYGKIIDVLNSLDGRESVIKKLFSFKNDYIDLGNGKIRLKDSYDNNGKLIQSWDSENPDAWKTEGLTIDLNNIDNLGYLNIMKYAENNTKRGKAWNRNAEAASMKFSKWLFEAHDKKHGTRIYDGVVYDSAPQPSQVSSNQFSNFRTATSTFYDKRDAYIIDQSKQYVGGQVSEVIPGMNSDEAQKNTKIVNQALDGRVLNDHFEIYYDNKKQEGTGTVQSFKEQYGIIGDVTVKDIKFATSPFMGEAVLQLQLQGKTEDEGSKTETVYFPAKQIQNTGLTEYMNSPAFKVEMEVNAARQSPVENTTIVFKKGSDDIGTTLTWDFNKDNSKNSETVLIQTADGGVQEFPVGHEVISFMINEAVSKGYSFWTSKD